MSIKLFPPQIEGTIPAFYGNELKVPFIMNKTVSPSEIAGFQIKIKSIHNDKLIHTSSCLEGNYDVTENMYAAFIINNAGEESSDLQIGGSYKVQIAYIEKDQHTIGYYSTVGVVKYTAKPDVTIGGLKHGELNINNNEYYGLYDQKNGDKTEKLYSYKFTVYDQYGAVYETTGEQLHNHENDDEVYLSKDRFMLTKTLEENKVYSIQYTGTTINGMQVESPMYRITQRTTIPPEIKASLNATMNYENGYVNLQIVGDDDVDGNEQTATGTYLICRASSEDGYTNWSEICRFAMFGEKPSQHSWKDFTVQHGYIYKYSLQQYNEKYSIYSNRMYSNEIEAVFEHSFLYDGKQQLKIKFNPKVTSFKDTLLETKTNTLGGKYPHFFRNGSVGYKEFPISGLVSYLSDDEQLFLSNEDMMLDDYSSLTRQHTLFPHITSSNTEYFDSMNDMAFAYTLQGEYKNREMAVSNENKISGQRSRTTNLTDYNIMAERIFKLKVLEWLNNGKPKLFRSPGEGNYVVRLMNSSLAPDDKVNRMLHTFSTTATEIDNSDFNTLNKYGFITIDEPDTKQLRWKTIDIPTWIKENGGYSNTDTSSPVSIGGEYNIQTLQCLDMMPGDKITIEFSDGSRVIQIGTTGAFYIKFDECPNRVTIPRNLKQGQITYGYYGTSMHHFDTYREIAINNLPVVQIIGASDTDLAERFVDIKNILIEYSFVNFTKRPVIDVIYKNNTYYINGEPYYSGHSSLKDLSEVCVYRINGGERYYDGRNGVGFGSPIEYSCKIYIDGREIDLSETDDYQLMWPDHIPEIKTSSGILTDISIQRREIVYDVECQDGGSPTVYALKRQYLNALNELSNYMRYNTLNKPSDDKDPGEELETDSNYYESRVKELRDKKDAAYINFLNGVKVALAEKEVYVE